MREKEKINLIPSSLLRVEIRVIPKGEWEKRFNRLINKIHKKSAQYPCEEIEADISQAIKKVRKGKRSR